ncbi:TetR/AcrR family transcriptional regulator [Oerskovia flava]|uniref:TetR/AcrR family transcriptional regulator n=1 Tax=Oerskovia flava TaxID=2986422 RepID=UPI002240D15B|nr:helix-turn-helix domain-containing protein [Oerskovia sp. JB1-3-2]
MTQHESPDEQGTAVDADMARVLDLLWKEQPRPRRGPKPALSLPRIVDAAVGIADAEGLAAVSMARIAEELGCSPMALYRYVDSKDDLLVLMTDTVARDLPDMPTDQGWRVGLEAWTRAQIRLAVERPWYLDLPLTAAPTGPTRLRWLDRGFAMLAGTGLGFGDKVQILGLVAQHVLGEARVQVEAHRAAVRAARLRSGVGDDVPESEIDPALVAQLNPYADFEELLARLADPQDFPALFSAAAEAAPDLSPGGAGEPVGDAPVDDDAGVGIEILLDGVAAYIAKRQAQQGT